MPTPRGYGNRNFGVEGFGLFTLDIDLEAENQIELETTPLYVVDQANTQVTIRQAKIKNVSAGLVILYRLKNIPRQLRNVPEVLRIAPRQTVLVALDAYDPEQIRRLRNKLKIIVDPVR